LRPKHYLTSSNSITSSNPKGIINNLDIISTYSSTILTVVSNLVSKSMSKSRIEDTSVYQSGNNEKKTIISDTLRARKSSDSSNWIKCRCANVEKFEWPVQLLVTNLVALGLGITLTLWSTNIFFRHYTGWSKSSDVNLREVSVQSVGKLPGELRSLIADKLSLTPVSHISSSRIQQ
jgi:hypothetical protein